MYNNNKCEFCGKLIDSEYRMKKHINICQSPSVHIFCSIGCKRKWCRAVSRGKIKVMN